MSQKMQIDRTIETDVLAIGGSGAGATAAVSARRSGARVALVSKGALGRSGNAIMAGASLAMDGESALAYGFTEADPSFTKQIWFNEIVKQSYFLAEQDLVQHYVDNAAPRVHELVEWGRRAGQNYVFFPPSGWLTSGKAIGAACRQGVKETSGIDVYEDIMVVDLLKSGDRVVGALGVDVYTGDLIAFKAKAVVLGTGGYQPFSFKCTVSDMTGDGMAMAYRAGARLADMEFLLFIPGVSLAPQKHRGSIFPFIWYLAGSVYPDMRNGVGESILDKMPKDMLAMAQCSEWAKLIYMYYWGKEIHEGRGTPNGGIYFDFSRVPKDVYENTTRQWLPMFTPWYGKEWRYQGDDFSDLAEMVEKGVPWEVGLSNEYSMGGVLIDRNMYTGVPGLYAAGEVGTGVFGAMRVADALTEMLVQGYTAGEQAAAFARSAGSEDFCKDHLAFVLQRVTAPLYRRQGTSGVNLHAKIESTADSGFNSFRDGKRLAAALDEVMRMRREDVPELSTKSSSRAYNYEWIEALQSDNLLTCTEAGIRAAILRKESRGTHIRTDYPTVNHDSWLQRIVARDVNGSMEMSTKKPFVTSMEPPAGTNKDIMDYAIGCESKFKNADLGR